MIWKKFKSARTLDVKFVWVSEASLKIFHAWIVGHRKAYLLKCSTSYVAWNIIFRWKNWKCFQVLCCTQKQSGGHNQRSPARTSCIENQTALWLAHTKLPFLWLLVQLWDVITSLVLFESYFVFLPLFVFDDSLMMRMIHPTFLFTIFPTFESINFVQKCFVKKVFRRSAL